MFRFVCPLSISWLYVARNSNAHIVYPQRIAAFTACQGWHFFVKPNVHFVGSDTYVFYIYGMHFNSEQTTGERIQAMQGICSVFFFFGASTELTDFMDSVLLFYWRRTLHIVCIFSSSTTMLKVIQSPSRFYKRTCICIFIYMYACGACLACLKPKGKYQMSWVGRCQMTNFPLLVNTIPPCILLQCAWEVEGVVLLKDYTKVTLQYNHNMSLFLINKRIVTYLIFHTKQDLLFL